MAKMSDYKKGAIIYFEGDDHGDKIFVLQNGHVDLSFTNLEGERVHDMVSTGEFFGVKSALGGYPREETATVVSDSKAMAFSIPEFEAFCVKNPRVIMKMLKVFSNQLRDVNKRLSKLTNEEGVNADDGLYSIGEFFIKQGKYDKASYILKKYIEVYPHGKNIINAQRNMGILQKMKKGGAS